MKILLIDNYDSFTYNLVHYLEGFDCEVMVLRNDEINLEHLPHFDKLVLSPGPGLPKEAGSLTAIIEKFYTTKPILGVCLGFQAITEFFGGEIYNQPQVKHGVSEMCTFKQESRLFNGLPKQFKIGLYHSWAAKGATFPDPLSITATSEHNVIMAFEHTHLPICGVQFHPESILSEFGHEIIANFLNNFN